jgi:hypothetical protein
MARLKWWVTDTAEQPLRKSKTKRAAITFALKEARASGTAVELHYAEQPGDILHMQAKIYPDGEISGV